MSQKRYVIVGTAQSWKRTPWDDQGSVIASLNDAYQLQPQGFKRADEWYDPHPLNKFVFPEGPLYPHQVPVGHYVRPVHHMAWLAAQSIPVYLHPDYLTQYPEAATWTNAHPFPRQAIVEHFGTYFTSTPQWMMAHAITRGFSDFAIYGIHLATQQEYREQRPGFEFLIGRVLGPGKLTTSVKDGLRHYETPNGHVALPQDSPVLQANYQYAFDARPSGHLAPIEWQLHKLQIKKERTVQALSGRPWWLPVVAVQEPGPDGKTVRRVCSTSALQSDLAYLNAAIADTQQELQRVAWRVGA